MTQQIWNIFQPKICINNYIILPLIIKRRHRIVDLVYYIIYIFIRDLNLKNVEEKKKKRKKMFNISKKLKLKKTTTIKYLIIVKENNTIEMKREAAIKKKTTHLCLFRVFFSLSSHFSYDYQNGAKIIIIIIITF